MRRLYVMPKAVHDKHLPLYDPSVTTHWLALAPSGSEADVAAWKAKGSPVVVSAQFANEMSQDRHEDHPEVTVLPNPVYQADWPLSKSGELPENQNNKAWGQTPAQKASLPVGFRGVGGLAVRSVQPSTPEGEDKVEMDGIQHLIDAGMGVMAANTVMDVHVKLAAVHPGFRLRSPR